MKVPVSEIIVGERTRKDMGDLAALAHSMSGPAGLIHPLTLDSRNRLVTGARRLAAAKQLGWTEIEVRVISTLDEARAALLAERDENTCRKDFEPTEQVVMGRRIEEVERENAKKRMQEGGKAGGQTAGRGRPKGSDNLPHPFPRPARTRQKVAEAVGTSPSTYEHAKKVVEAAEQNPERYGDLPKQMDETTVGATYRELGKRKQQEQQPDEPKRPENPAADPLLELLASAIKESQRLTRCKELYPVGWESVISHLEHARRGVRDYVPQFDCPICAATGKKNEKPCTVCRGTRLVVESIYRRHEKPKDES